MLDRAIGVQIVGAISEDNIRERAAAKQAEHIQDEMEFASQIAEQRGAEFGDAPFSPPDLHPIPGRSAPTVAELRESVAAQVQQQEPAPTAQTASELLPQILGQETKRPQTLAELRAAVERQKQSAPTIPDPDRHALPTLAQGERIERTAEQQREYESLWQEIEDLRREADEFAAKQQRRAAGLHDPQDIMAALDIMANKANEYLGPFRY